MPFRQLEMFQEFQEPKPIVPEIVTPSKKTSKALERRGCENCTLNKVPGVRKIFGKITGKTILLIAQSPGPRENEEGLELLGPAGEFLWDELDRIGIRRKDVDIQNAVRCYPADATEGTYNVYLKMRNPTPAEISCCSVYTERALAKSPAKQILIFGVIAAKQVLQTRSLPEQKIFWSDKLGVKVYLLDHPAFFIRGYGAGPRLEAFRKTLDQVAEDRAAAGSGKEFVKPDQFAFLKAQDYRLVLNLEQALEAEKAIHAFEFRVTVDIESDDFEDGNHVFACGIGLKPGLVYVFVFRHKDQNHKDGRRVWLIFKRIVGNREIHKALHYGCSDARALEREGAELAGFDHDTMLSEYFRQSDQQHLGYGLQEIAERRFPQFSGYKQVRVPDVMAVVRADWERDNPGKKLPAVFRGTLEAQGKYLENNRLLHLRHLSLESLRLYNGGDCHATKKIEAANKNTAPAALMRLYIDFTFVLAEMEDQGPLFDYEQCSKLETLYPLLEKPLLVKLREMCQWPEYNPGSHQQVKVAIYQKLGLDFPFDGEPNTQKMTLLMLGREHEFPRVQLRWRAVTRVIAILKAYRRSAEAWRDRLRTKWKSTGTRTGRISSGGERKRKESTIVNLQNIKKDAQVRNLCVADKEWRKFYRAAWKVVKECPEMLKYWAECDAESAKARVEHRAPAFPKPLAVAQDQIDVCQTLLQEIVEEEMPDLRTFLVEDYGQIEVRVAAQLANDKNLIADCQKSDIHTTVGVTMTGWDADRIKNDEETRTLTKNCIAEGQRVLTDFGLIPIQDVQLWMKVWDGVEFVSHDGVICQGVRKVIQWDRLVATPDHVVWGSDGQKRILEDAKREGISLCITGIEENPVRDPYYRFQSNSSDSEQGLSGRLRFMFANGDSVGGVGGPEGEGQVQTALVYDILNAGPRHRFTVEGRLVSNCHFGILFGISKKNLFKFVVAMSPVDMRDRITQEQIEQAYDRYFERYPGIGQLIQDSRSFAKKHGYVETLFGMRQHLNVTPDEEEDIKAFAEVEDEEESNTGGRTSWWGNQAVNGKVQGSAHQLLVCALVNLRRQPKQYEVLGVPVMEVHDALYFSVRVLDILQALAKAKYLLEHESLNTVKSDFPKIKWEVPIVVDAKAGIRLGCLVKITEKMSVGEFLLNWFRECRKQVKALDKELEQAASQVA